MERKVIIRRKEVLNHLPKEIRAGARIKLGSIFVDRLPLKGVDGEEEGKLLKRIIDSPFGHPEFAAKSKDFWASLSLRVPFEGVELDISTHDDGSPVNAMDYIYWKWCLKHRHVAANEEEMKNDGTKRFYIYDPQKDLLKRSEKIQVKKEADKEFIKVSVDDSKMKMLLRVLLNGDPERTSKVEIENALYDYKEKNPERFLKYSQDTNLEIRFEIEELIAKSILRKIGNQIIYEDETLGEDIKDTITFFKNKKNSGLVNILRARLKEVS